MIIDTDLPLVSIVTPSYNQGRFLRRTIESVLGQTYPHIEYCVMDGGSTDDSVAILKSYGDRFPWVSESDRGQTHAINKGLARSRGAIRAYLNSDDVLLPHAVERAVAYFAQHPGCDLVYGRADLINERDEVIGAYDTEDYSFQRLAQICCICQPACFWRADIAGRAGPFDERLHYVMDYEYWLRLDRAGGRLEHAAETWACSRIYAETKTASGRAGIFREIFRVVRRHAGYVDIGFFRGYWHHLCRERDRGWPRRLRWLPRFQSVMAHLHHLWWNWDCRAVGRAQSPSFVSPVAAAAAPRTPVANN
jgi:glycosyltransferase involved in cell wall biosynthesis